MNNVKGSGGNAGAFCAPTYSCLIENNQPKALSSNLRERLARMIDEKTRNHDGFVSVISWIVLPTTSVGIYCGSAKRANSAIAGQTGACVMRSRTLVVVTNLPRKSRQLPMLVPPANSSH